MGKDCYNAKCVKIDGGYRIEISGLESKEGSKECCDPVIVLCCGNEEECCPPKFERS